MLTAVTREVNVPVGVRTPAQWLEHDTGLVARFQCNGREIEVRWIQTTQNRVTVVACEIHTNTHAPTQVRDNVYRFHAARATEDLLTFFDTYQAATREGGTDGRRDDDGAGGVRVVPAGDRGRPGDGADQS